MPRRARGRARAGDPLGPVPGGGGGGGMRICDAATVPARKPGVVPSGLLGRPIAGDHSCVWQLTVRVYSRSRSRSLEVGEANQRSIDSPKLPKRVFPIITPFNDPYLEEQSISLVKRINTGPWQLRVHTFLGLLAKIKCSICSYQIKI